MKNPNGPSQEQTEEWADAVADARSADSNFYDATRQLILLASLTPPAEFQARFAALIGNVVGNLPEDYWREFIRIRPCSEPGCDCHQTVKKNAVDIFKLLRGDHAEHVQVHSGPA